MRADVTKSPYGPLHAIAAGAVLLYVMVVRQITSVGFSAFWRYFLYGDGAKMPADAKSIAIVLLDTTVVFGGTALLVWLSTFFVRGKGGEPDGAGLSPLERKEGLVFALKAALPVTFATILVSVACATAFEKLTGVKLADQPLVDFLRGGGGSLAAKSIAVLLVVVEAPVLEEPIFRGIMFRGFARSMPLWGAMILSGFVFALVHLNASTFIPLWFIGAAFAWVYWKTGTILAPMLVHFLFNLLNLCLAFLFPDM